MKIPMAPSRGYRAKIVGFDDLARISSQARTRGKRSILCHGEFEVMHPGHTRHLEWARRQGDILFVTLADDTVEWTSKVPT